MALKRGPLSEDERQIILAKLDTPVAEVARLLNRSEDTVLKVWVSVAIAPKTSPAQSPEPDPEVFQPPTVGKLLKDANRGKDNKSKGYVMMVQNASQLADETNSFSNNVTSQYKNCIAPATKEE